jgi:hypothetical protein
LGADSGDMDVETSAEVTGFKLSKRDEDVGKSGNSTKEK